MKSDIARLDPLIVPFPLVFSDEMKGIREKTRIGRPLGTNDFI